MKEEQQVKKPTPLEGLIITVVIVVASVICILLGSKLFNVTSFFASFLFLWYWAAIEEANFDRWLPTFIGAFTGLLLALQLKYLPMELGTTGMIVSILILVFAVYIHIMDWVPIALNKAAMLFLTVFAAPPILEIIDPIEVATAIALGALFFGSLIKLVQLVTPTKEPEKVLEKL